MTLPRLLIIDFTPMAGPAATSALKAAHFGDWPEEKLLHLTVADTLYLALADRRGGRSTLLFGDEAAMAAVLDTFKPELILYRPVSEHPHLHRLAMRLIDESQTPVAIWMMDDWPERLRHEDPARWQAMHRDLLALTGRAALNLAISPGMAKAFGERYGVPFRVARNVVDPRDWPAPAGRAGNGIELRYSGALAPDMSLTAIEEVARAVASREGQANGLSLAIRTQRHWLDRYAGRFSGMAGVSISEAAGSAADYRAFLRGGDVVLIAYNRDEATERYLRFSFANKAPEALASGRAVLAYGPTTIETMAFLAETGACAVAADPEELRSQLARLSADPGMRGTLGEKGREVAFGVFSAHACRTELQGWLAAAAAPADPAVARPVTAALRSARRGFPLRRVKRRIGRTLAALRS